MCIIAANNQFKGVSRIFLKIKTVRHSSISQHISVLLRTERLQLCWYGHVTKMSHKRTAKQLMDTFPSGKSLRGRPRVLWQNYVEDLAWSRLGISPGKLPLVAGDLDAWRFQLELLHPQPQKDKRAKRNTLK